MIYFIQVGQDGPIKIGTTTDIEKRLMHLSNASPFRLRLLACIEGGVKREAEIHERFIHLRGKREWFEPGADLLEFIATEGVEWFAQQALVSKALSHCTSFHIRAHVTRIAALVRQKTGEPFTAKKLSQMLNSVRVNPKDVDLLARGLGVTSADLLRP